MLFKVDEKTELRKEDLRRITVRYPYTCDACGREFPKGVIGYWKRTMNAQVGRSIVLCQDCFARIFLSDEKDLEEKEACLGTIQA